MEIYWFYSILNYDYNLFPNPPGRTSLGNKPQQGIKNKTPAFAGVTIIMTVIIEPNTR